jgi:hypothetical protein
MPSKRITPVTAGRRPIKRARPAVSSRRREPAMPAINQTGQRLDEQAMREYLRDLGSDLRYWYQAAETKAQVVLSVNGLFVTFLTASALASKADVVQATAAFGAETWAFLAGMSLCMTLAILSAVACLASRGLGRRKLQRLLSDYAVDPDKADTYAPEMTVFFYFLSALKAAPFIERLRTADQDFIMRALSSDILDFAPYVVAKHRWVNQAFIMTGMTLGFFLCACVSYVIRVHLAALPRHLDLTEPAGTGSRH